MMEEQTVDEETVTLAIFADYICKSDGKVLLNKLDLVASSFDLTDLERLPLNDLQLVYKYEVLFFRMFELWIKKVEAKDGRPTLEHVAKVLKKLDINSVEVNLKNQFKSLGRIIVVPKAVMLEPELEPSKGDKVEDEREEVKKEEKSTGGIKKLFSSKKTKATGDKKLKGVTAGSKQQENEEEKEEELPWEIKFLTNSDAKELMTFLASFQQLDTSLQILQILCRSVYHIAAVVPKEDSWISKIVLVTLETFSIIRHFIEAGRGIHRDKFESVVRRYIIDPGLAPHLIGALVAAEMLIPKKDEKKALILMEPAVKDTMDEIRQLKAIAKIHGSPLSVSKVEEKLLTAIVAAVEEHKSLDDQKAFGRKLSPHINYIVRAIVWPLKHPGFHVVQGRIPKLIRFCSESVIVVAKTRYESLPSASDEDLAIFNKAYAKAQEEKCNLMGLAAGVAIGAGVGAALTVGALAAVDSD